MNSSLQKIRKTATKAWEARPKSGRPEIAVVIDKSSLARGGQETLAALKSEIADNGFAVDVSITGSWGFCWMEPTLTIRNKAGNRTVLYGNVTADRAPELLRTAAVEGKDIPELALGVVAGEATDEVPMLAEHQFMQGQVRRLMANLGITNPENIDHYLAHGGYEGFEKALEMTPEAIIEQVLDSGLGGRGGGGFPAGRKWDFLRTATAEPKYLVCNADEGDPGAWVNRILLEGDPHLIIEGLLIAAIASGASEGYVYIRHEYPLALERMKIATEQAYERGLLGKNILGSDLDFDLVNFKGAGSYVCGEETGLINSVDGYRGMPRIRPPFPAQAGLWNKPTNVNNVETYANAPLIMRNGAAWWSQIGSAKEKGTKMFSLSGQINWQGCFEIPFGPPVGHLLQHFGDGMQPGSVLKGYQPGGPLSGILPSGEIELPVALDPFRERGMFLGSGGIVFFDQHTSIIDMCLSMLAFCEDESCGRCTTCRGGTQRVVEILRRIADGGGRETDLKRFEEIIQTLVWSNCLHGQFSPTALKLALRYFREEFLAVVRDKVDPSHSLPAFIEYRVAHQSDPELQEAVAICPTDAFDGEDPHVSIVQNRCIKCDACFEVAPNAIERRDRSISYVPAASSGD
ncbi:MAG TPA: NADH-ubiquinone oxidoreductase-F iron-sulfur binding region domain-containing protein [Dehalococcoidia bacterium]|nr:NADH-ubiquinone oxidoreductase-F iron-sulfur binding region domain-containing protein [Dehalococcoidia bacterium]